MLLIFIWLILIAVYFIKKEKYITFTNILKGSLQEIVPSTRFNLKACTQLFSVILINFLIYLNIYVRNSYKNHIYDYFYSSTF